MIGYLWRDAASRVMIEYATPTPWLVQFRLCLPERVEEYAFVRRGLALDPLKALIGRRRKPVLAERR